MGGDLLIAFLAHQFGILVRFGRFSLLDGGLYLDIFRILLFAFVLLFTTYFSELYSSERRFRLKEVLVRICISLVLAYGVLSGIYYLEPSVGIRGIKRFTRITSYNVCYTKLLRQCST